MSNNVLLTRAEGQNETLAALLEKASIRPVIIPMLVIEPREADHRDRRLVMNLDRFDHIVFVSGNAVVFAMDLLERYWPQWPAALHWHAVGEATAGLLRQRDIEPWVPAQHSTEGLLASGVFDRVEGAKIMIVRGVGGRESLAQSLRERGADVTYLEVYERRAVSLDTAAKQALLALLPAVAVVYSGETLQALASNLDNVREGLSIVVPSGRVGHMAAMLGFTRVTVAGGADENAMLAAVLSARD